MAEYKIQGETLTAIADAIRAKKDTTAFLTPAQMAVEIESIVIGNDLPNAEDATFSVTKEYVPGMVSTPSLFGTSTQVQFKYGGYKFKANRNFGVYGFRHYAPVAGTYNLTLYDVTNSIALATASYTASEINVWTDITVAVPVNLIQGDTYIVYGDGKVYAYGDTPTYHSNIGSLGCFYGSSEPPSTSKSYKSAADILMGDVVGESAVAEYKIQTTTMNDIAEEVKRITGTSGGLTPAQMVSALQNADGDIIITDDGEGNVTITTSGSVSVVDDGEGNVTIT